MTAIRPLLDRSITFVSFEELSPGRAVTTHICGLAAGLIAEGWQVRIVAESSDSAKAVSILIRIWRYLRVTVRSIRCLVSRDVLLVRSHPAMLPILVYGRLIGCLAVVEINGLPKDVAVTYRLSHQVAFLMRKITRLGWRTATHIVAVTHGLAECIAAEVGSVPVSYVPNGVDTAFFCPGTTARPDAGYRYALFYGDIAAWHGIDDLLAATRSSYWPEAVRLVVIGRGSAMERLDVPADLVDRVMWFDRMPSSSLLPYICHAEVGLVPITNPSGRSSNGVLPLKLLEMMACARPVVVTDLPGQSELVREADCGLVVPVGRPDRLAAAVAELSQSEDAARMGLRGRQAVVAHYDWRAVARIFQSAIEGR